MERLNGFADSLHEPRAVGFAKGTALSEPIGESASADIFLDHDEPIPVSNQELNRGQTGQRVLLQRAVDGLVKDREVFPHIKTVRALVLDKGDRMAGRKVRNGLIEGERVFIFQAHTRSSGEFTHGNAETETLRNL